MNSAISPAVADVYDNAAFETYCTRLRDEIPANNRVLLVQIPQVILGSLDRTIALDRSYYAFPPTGLQYIYEAIRHRGLDVEILDLNIELLKRIHTDPDFDQNNWPDILDEALERFQPFIVGVSCLFDMGIAPMLEVLRRTREWGKSIVVSGGVIATYEWKTLLDQNLSHFVIRGEGENKLNYLLDNLMSESHDQAQTPDIFFDDGAGPQESHGAPDVVNVRGDLVASYDLVRIEEYYKYGSLNPFSRGGSAPFAAIQLSRGCRAQCTFCAVRDFMGKGVRHRDVEECLREMEFLVTERGVHHFEWLDDDPTFFRNEFKDVLRGVIAKGWDIRWSANNGVIAASVDEELLALMRDSGCIGFKVGIETGNEEMLRKVKKPAKHYKFLEMSEMLTDYPELFVGGNFIIGLPEETFGQMMDSFRFALEVNLDWAAVTVCQVIRGASAFSDSGEYFENQMKTEGAEIKNFIPTRVTGGVVETDDGIYRHLDIFRHPPEIVPSEEQAKEIWFAFNMMVNYVNNKNLHPGGKPQKFVNWVLTAQRAYPTNPYMMLFLGLAYRLLGEDAKAEDCHKAAIGYVNSDYWHDRFKSFHIANLLEDFPADSQAVFDRLQMISERQKEACADWLALPRGMVPGQDGSERVGEV